MSRDYYLLLDTESSPNDLRETMAASGSVKAAENGWLVSEEVNVQVNPATPGDLRLPEPGIPKATCTVLFIPDAQAEDAIHKVFRIAVTLMQRHHGDAALAAQDASTAVLRLNGVVYLDPAQTVFDRVTSEDFAPMMVVQKMPTVAA